MAYLYSWGQKDEQFWDEGGLPGSFACLPSDTGTDHSVQVGS